MLETARQVLVADDDDDMRDAVASSLRSHGYDVFEVRDGAALVERLTHGLADPQAMPDIVITDIRMPNLSGLGVLTALRRARMALPVIVITAFKDASVRTFAERLGAVAVLRKPFEMDELLSAVRDADRLRAR